VKKKSNQRWFKILAYVPGKRKDIVFKQLKALLDTFFWYQKVTIRMIGVLRNVALRLINIRLTKVIHKKLNGKFKF